MVVHCQTAFIHPDPKYAEYFAWFPYPLSDFQKWAIYAIVNGHHSLITAHTGSGKTLPAEFAIQFFKRQGKKVIYTAPIKALCNQKLYDLRQKFPHISFGILTGDIKDNPEADVLIMTTEILRNTLFTKKMQTGGTGIANPVKTTVSIPSVLQFEIDIETELGAVVFDEVHYIGDKDRGSVWEQSILLLPPQVQQIMLSATIEKPEVFALWVETEKNKNQTIKRDLYMTTTLERVVPLTHYAWITANKSIIKDAKTTPYEQKFKDLIGKPIVLADSLGNYNEPNYHRVKDVLNYFQKNKEHIKRKYVLNDLVKYLNCNEMLPAICFVFSRKNVEMCAQEIGFTLFDKDDKTPSIIEHECEKILIGKLTNYKEYTNLEEYRTMIDLLKKGIAIHHAGIMPILREMVELLFERKYIKLLFATETFAVGINMPTKTVIFSSVSKFSGNDMRCLLSHEYTQMAGRAGRRGIDTIGHVIHCSNLFDIPDNNTYKKMLTGAPKMLTSQFRVSFNLVLSIISSNARNLAGSIDYQLITFMEQSFIKNEITKEVNNYDVITKDIEKRMIEAYGEQKLCSTPIKIIQEYYDLYTKMDIVSNKQKKQFQREIDNLDLNNLNLKKDIKVYEKIIQLKIELSKNNDYKFEAVNYIQNNIDKILDILKDKKFITSFLKVDDDNDKATVATQLHELHPLAMADLYESTSGFKDITATQLICLFSCFTNVSIQDDKRAHQVYCGDPFVKQLVETITTYINKYYDLEAKHHLETGTDYTLHYELIDYIQAWCVADDEVACKNIIIKIKEEKEIFLGEFIKAILKINNIAQEFEKVAEMLQNFALLKTIKEIPGLILKYVATNQSLYI